MSEYQYVAFRAIDGPVSEKNLKYMEKQSSRAEITPWAFDNEYHFGDFRGNAVEMLRRGYDFHLHYANFGTRTLMIRLPNGFPDADAAKPYLGKHSLRFLKDKQGPGGTLSIEPFYEPDDLEELWEVAEIIDRLAPLRAEILDGDLRPLYLAHLAMSCDGNHDPGKSTEGPVPAGLGKLTSAQRELAEFYDLGDALISAAARESPPMSAKIDPQAQQSQWIRSQPETTKNEWLAKLLSDPKSAVRGEILAEFRNSRGEPSWPTMRLNRTIAQLQVEAEVIEGEDNRKADANAARKRARKLADMAAEPDKYLRETEQLATERTMAAYRQISEILVDLREAIGGSDRAGLAEEHAQTLRKANPKLYLLISALRKKGFLPK